MKTNTTHKRLHGFKISLLALSIVGSTLLHAQTVSEIPPLDYDTIQGDFEGDSLFLDTGSDTSLLSTTEWYQIQAYATAAISLPTTEASLRTLTKFPASDAFTYEYQNLLSEFTSINQSGHDWNSNIYPSIVDLALQLANYGDIHPQLILPLMNQLTQLQQNALVFNLDAAATNRDAALSFLNVLKNFTHIQQQATTKAVENLKQFAADVEAQKAQLDVIEGDFSTLLNSDSISTLRHNISLLNDEIAGYRDDLSEAKRNIGLCAIGGPLVLTICGSIEGARKVRLDNLIADIDNQINAANASLEHAVNLGASYEIAHSNINDMLTHIENALPQLKKVQLHWQGLESDFDSLTTSLNSLDSEDALRNANLLVAGIVSSPLAGTVGPKWLEISNKARQFAQNAYVIME
ncbi:alpha-xenorhabdolysin family binary toxin subunit A [Moritella marina ATCC 15381]|uniref:Alpha-xenorhabdolysin family binary toxin subunit A n=1 Tax=Moritella marina ATCC 15381 TaxID=1202962 RepID=A0A5J6WIC2_MORMI|nr:alpha-xenorhabdolysin family binary toxin subunit A [Moritella marina]QFI37816.1 alpha-xenorhabdolysin family binary toxin subunit A [Moritella marina ATCC 15381]